MFEKEFDVKQIYYIILKHIYIFIGIFIIVLAFFGGYLLKAKKVYQATSTIEIEPRAANILGRNVEDIGGSSSGYYWSNREYYNTQYEIIKSRAVAAKVLSNIGDEKLMEKIPAKNKSGSKNKIDLISMVQSKITVSPLKNSNIVHIGISDYDPELAAFLANSVADAYVDFNMEQKFNMTKNAAKWLSEQSINLKKQLEDSELALHDFRKRNDVLASTFEDRQTILSDKILNISKNLTEKEMYQKTLSSKIEEIKKIDKVDVEFAFSNNPNSVVIKNLKVKYLEIDSKLEEKRKFYGEKHPEVMKLSEEMQNMQKAYMQEVQGVVDGFAVEQKSLDKELVKLKTMLKEAQTEALSLNKLEIDYNKFKREVETNKKLYDIVLERTKEADLSALLKSNNIRVIDRALIPIFPIKPRTNVILFIGLLAALFAGFSAVVLMELLDTKIRDMDELERIVASPVLGFFPKFQNPETAKVKEIVFEGTGYSSSIESLRTIRTNIRLAYPDENIRSVLITSSESQEGKTTVSSNLAVSFASTGKRVLLVDTDMRKPRVHKVFGISNAEGISNYILGEKSLEEVIKHDVYGGLDVLFCGPIPPNPVEMIESNKFKDMVAKLEEMYDLVIFDSPPIAAVADAAGLAPLLDAVVLVVKVHQLSRDTLRRAMKTLSSTSIPMLGVIVNNVDLKTGNRYGAYYYYYHNKYYGEAESENKT